MPRVPRRTSDLPKPPPEVDPERVVWRPANATAAKLLKMDIRISEAIVALETRLSHDFGGVPLYLGCNIYWRKYGRNWRIVVAHGEDFMPLSDRPRRQRAECVEAVIDFLESDEAMTQLEATVKHRTGVLEAVERFFGEND